MSSTKHTRRVFQWLDQVAIDPGLPASAFKVAYVIAQHLNEDAGVAFPGTDRIAERIAMSQATVWAMVQQLAAKGHLEIETGRQGSGHSNKYRWVFKPKGEKPGPRVIRKRRQKHQPAGISGDQKHQPAGISESSGKHQSSEKKYQPTEKKHQPAGMNHLGTTSITTQRVGEANPSTDNLSEDRAKAVTVTRRQSFNLFRLCYPKDFRDNDREAALAAFELALDGGHSPEELQKAASDAGEAYRRGASIPNLIDFLNSFTSRPAMSPFHRAENDHA